MTECPVPNCTQTLTPRPDAKAYTPPFAPHKDWCPVHGYQPVPMERPPWRPGPGMKEGGADG